MPRLAHHIKTIAAAAAMLLAMQAHAVSTASASQHLTGHNGWSSGASTANFGSLAEMQINVTGITSVGEPGDPGNTVLSFNIGAGTLVTGIGWNVNVTAYSPSWLSEMAVSFSNSSQTAGVDLAVGAGDDLPGIGMAYSSGIVDLVGLGLSFAAGADGIVRLEFYDAYDDPEVSPDGLWNSGFLTLQTAVVPEPSSYGLMALGLFAVGVAARRRRRD